MKGKTRQQQNPIDKNSECYDDFGWETEDEKNIEENEPIENKEA